MPAAIRRAVWFYYLRLAQLADEGYQLCVAETTVDEEEPQLLSRDVLHERFATIDEALARSSSFSLLRVDRRDQGSISGALLTEPPSAFHSYYKPRNFCDPQLART